MNLLSATHGNAFPTTRWSIVMIAAQDHSKAYGALNDLCRKYWWPIYAFARHRGCPVHDAEDLTQAYFAHLLERGYIQRAQKEKGKFRAFLIQDLKFFMSHEAGKGRAEKRGGKATIIPLDVAWAESRMEFADPTGDDPDAYFDRQWALETVRLARMSLAQDYTEQGKKTLFDALQTGLVSPPTAVMQEIWRRDLAMTAGALKVALHRLRERFRAALEAQIMETVTTEEELQSEMRHLQRALSRSQSDG